MPLPVLTDSYKATHFSLYPPDAQTITAYGEFRQAYAKDPEDQRMVYFGIRYVLEEYVQRQWTPRDVELAEAFFNTHNAGYTRYPFPRHLFLKFIQENQGWFPIRIESLPEGSVVYPHTPVMQLAAHNEYAPLVTYLETVLLMAWYPSTVATLSRRSRTTIDRYFRDTVDEASYGALESRMHDFGFRGCTCVEQAMIGGAAHLLSFEGTDNLSAAYHTQYRLNGGRPVGTSVPATEHSVMTSYRSERQAVRRAIQEYGRGVYTVVMDSYDYSKALKEILPSVKEQKLEQGGFMVVRPDSGDMVEVVLEGLRATEKVFGAAKNSKGYKVICGASVIQGDGVSSQSLQKILEAVKREGYSAESVGFGMGGGLLQKLDRDTMSMAIKVSSITDSTGTRGIMKSPKTGSSKLSLPGRFKVIADDSQQGAPVAHPMDAKGDSLLQVVYDCGPVKDHQWDDFDTVRQRLDAQWNKYPPKAQAVSQPLLDLQKTFIK